jgi:hypothetical protein
MKIGYSPRQHEANFDPSVPERLWYYLKKSLPGSLADLERSSART